MVSDSGWAIADSSVAELRAPVLDTSAGSIMIPAGSRRMYVKAHRPGRTTIRVVGLHSTSDTAPSRTPPDRALTREVIVTHRPRRLRIEPRIDTVMTRTPVEVRVRAFDASGVEIPGIPLHLEVVGDAIYPATTSAPTSFAVLTAGRGRLVVSLGGLADTVSFTVLDSAQK